MKNAYEKNKVRQPMANSGHSGGNTDVFNAMAPRDNTDPIAHKQAKIVKTPVELPRHLFLPENVSTLDFRKLITVQNGTNRESLMRFEAPAGCVTRFIAYGVFNDAESADTTELIPTVDGVRVFPYHGDPTNNFKIALGLAPDLSQQSLIPVQLTLLAGQVLEWFVTNTSGVDCDMGVRMVGYFDAAEQSETPRFGG